MAIDADGKIGILSDGKPRLVQATMLVDATGAPVTTDTPIAVQVVSGAASVGDFLLVPLTGDGTPGGEADASDDFSGSPGRRWYTVPSGKRYDITAIKMLMYNSGGCGGPNDFGPITNGLSEGIGINTASGDGTTVRQYLFFPQILRTTAAWFNNATGLPITSILQNVGGPTSAGFVWTLSTPLSVVADDCIQVQLNDDLSPIGGIFWLVEGRLVDV